jgi:hypothetical protein
MIIHTVYRPEETLDYLDDWLNHHVKIGVTHFYMYDNGGGVESRIFDFYDKNKQKHFNKHGVQYKYNVNEAIELQKDILKKYPVTVLKWQRKNKDGIIEYAQKDAILNFAKNFKSGLCAFIDVDEFIIKKESFKQCRLQQHKYKSMFYYSSVYNCHERVPLKYTKNWNPKAILDMSNFPHNFEDVHFRNIDLPESKNFFNHYNHNEISHTAYDHAHDKQYGLFKDISFENIFEHVKDTGLIP